MKQYLDLCRRIVNEGEWVANERTGKRCLTVINADLEYDVANNQFPLITTRKSYWKAAIAEFLGYIRGYDNAADFRKLVPKRGMPMLMKMRHGLPIHIVKVPMIWDVFMVCKAEHGVNRMAKPSINFVKL
jgi:hypothetical protein